MTLPWVPETFHARLSISVKAFAADIEASDVIRAHARKKTSADTQGSLILVADSFNSYIIRLR